MENVGYLLCIQPSSATSLKRILPTLTVLSRGYILLVFLAVSRFPVFSPFPLRTRNNILLLAYVLNCRITVRTRVNNVSSFKYRDKLHNCTEQKEKKLWCSFIFIFLWCTTVIARNVWDLKAKRVRVIFLFLKVHFRFKSIFVCVLSSELIIC